jgi:large subunit ribosomal protein L12
MGMENVYAAMLLHKAGKEINEESLTAVLSAAGVTADPVQVKALVASLSEVNIDEALKAAPTMMSAAPAAAAAAAPAEQKPAAAPPEDKKKKEEEEKKKEEAALEGLGALFG